jgi:hypothetical protein
MFALIEIFLTVVAWKAGKIFANNFEGMRPKKSLALIFGLIFAFALFGLFVVVRYYVAGAILNDETLKMKVEWFGPLDPPALFLYVFFAYNGAVSYYVRPKK